LDIESRSDSESDGFHDTIDEEAGAGLFPGPTTIHREFESLDEVGGGGGGVEEELEEVGTEMVSAQNTPMHGAENGNNAENNAGGSLSVGGSEEHGRPKRKRVPRQTETDALNSCLCGLVVDPMTEAAVQCTQPGCETEWVSPSIHDET